MEYANTHLNHKIYRPQISTTIVPNNVNVYPETLDESDYQGSILSDGVSGMTKYINSTNKDEYFISLKNNQNIIDLANISYQSGSYNQRIFYYYPTTIEIINDNSEVSLMYIRNPSILPDHVSIYIVSTDYAIWQQIYGFGNLYNQITSKGSYYIVMYDETQSSDFAIDDYWHFIPDYCVLLVSQGGKYESMGFTIDLGNSTEVGFVQFSCWGDGSDTKIQLFAYNDDDDDMISHELIYENNGQEPESTFRINLLNDRKRYIRIVVPLDYDNSNGWHHFVFRSIVIYSIYNKTRLKTTSRIIPVNVEPYPTRLQYGVNYRAGTENAINKRFNAASLDEYIGSDNSDQYFFALMNGIDLSEDEPGIGFIIDLGSQKKVGTVQLYMPDTWTETWLCVQSSTDGANFVNDKVFQCKMPARMYQIPINKQVRYIRFTQLQHQTGGWNFRFVVKGIEIFTPPVDAAFKIISKETK